MKRNLLKLSLHRYMLLFPAILLATYSEAQDLTKLWTGLRYPQPVSELPKGNAPFQKVQRISKKNVPSKLQPIQQGEWIVGEGWELADGTSVIGSQQWIFDSQFKTDAWYNATVPGTVLTTLVDQGVYPDPYFGLNNLYIPDSLSRMDWWYRNAFEVPADITGKQVYLLFDGINYRADVFLNGEKTGDMKGAFVRGCFNVTSLIRKNGKNVLAVHVFPPNNPGIPHEQSMIAGQGLNGGMLSEDGPTFISSIGWDWMPGIRDRNTGLWQNVRLKIGGDVLIGDPLVVTDIPLPDTTQAMISVRTSIKNVTSNTVNGTLTVKTNHTEIALPYFLSAYEEKELVFSPSDFKELTIKNPRLWWPNGYGKPELYDLALEARVDGQFSDLRKLHFGIREMSYELMVNADKGNIRYAYTPTKTVNQGAPVFDYDKRVFYTQDIQLPTLAKEADTSGLEKLPLNDPIGPYLAIRVNGVRIFCRGGNWGMDDAMKRVSREKLEPYFKLHQNANFNMIRNWTGESTEDIFYTLCDEYGILVWNDFWITTDDTVEPNDMALFMRNATDVVRRFRNHPSIAIWCPRNEGFAPDELAQTLPKMMAKEDPTRHYHGQSRHLNMGTSGPWGYFKDPSLYYTQNAKGFLTEIGTFAMPTANTIRKFIAPEDLWPINDVWAYHDLHHKSQRFDDFMAAVNNYGRPTDMEDFVRKAQLVTYDAWRNIMEAWNSKMWNTTTGQILWMSHPAWPSMIWQTYTYDYETPGSYFGVKKACEPLHIQMNLPKHDIIVSNTTLNKCSALTANVRFIDLQGKLLYKRSTKIDSKANGITNCFTPDKKERLPSIYLARLDLKDKRGITISVNDYWVTDGKASTYQDLNKLQAVRLNIRMSNLDGEIMVEVSNPSKTIAAAIKLNVMDKATKKIILPAYFSDGYFNLLAGEKRVIMLEKPNKTMSGYTVIAEGYNVKAD